MTQEYCLLCRNRFFADDDDFIEGKPVCSFCTPKVVVCEVCRGLTLYKRIPKFDETVCAKCAPSSEGYDWVNPYNIKRFMTFRRDGFTCRYCGRSPMNDPSVELECDHIVPRSRGGPDKLANFVTACKECNRGKLAFSLTPNEQKRLVNRPDFRNQLSDRVPAPPREETIEVDTKLLKGTKPA